MTQKSVVSARRLHVPSPVLRRLCQRAIVGGACKSTAVMVKESWHRLGEALNECTSTKAELVSNLVAPFKLLRVFNRPCNRALRVGARWRDLEIVERFRGGAEDD